MAYAPASSKEVQLEWVSVLQQQIADLTLLLKPQASPKAEQDEQPLTQACTPSSRSRPVSKPPRKPVHVIPRVEDDKKGQYVVICPKRGLLPFEPETPEWFAWVAEQESFRFVGKEGHFTAHHWWRVPRGAWRAHRHIRNQSYVLRLAPNRELTIAILEHAAQQLQAHLA